MMLAEDQTPKVDHVRPLPLADLKPAPENTKVYRPVDPNDPDVEALAESIRQVGVLEPLVVTEDGYILSGHRRYEAARQTGLREVPCRVEPFRREDDPERFLKLLVSHNRQRVKGRDEAIREEVVLADREVAYEALKAHRRAAAALPHGVEALVIGAGSGRKQISKAKYPLLNAMIAVLKDVRAYWPVPDRMIHYRLLNAPPLIHASKPKSVYRNDQKSYRALVDVLTRARVAGLVPMNVICDSTRPITQWAVHQTPQAYVRDQLDSLFLGYQRDLQQGQPRHIEIVAEKLTVQAILEPVASEYTIPLTISRGYCSLPPRYALAGRFRKSGRERLALLVVSDFDPDGDEIAASLAKSLRDDFGIRNVDPIKVALTEDQVERFQLPPGARAKEDGSRWRKFVERHGDHVYELEALRPEDLQTLLREAIESVLDRAAFDHEVNAEGDDAVYLEARRRIVLDGMEGARP